jgi:hypothetical protein
MPALARSLVLAALVIGAGSTTTFAARVENAAPPIRLTVQSAQPTATSPTEGDQPTLAERLAPKGDLSWFL